MSMSWLPISEPCLNRTGRVEARVLLTPDSPWFEGHFPGQPIFPGVAMLGLVAEVVRQHGRTMGRNLTISGFNRVRFKALAFPGQELDLSVAVMPAGGEAKLPFDINRQGLLISQGVILVQEPDAKPRSD
jgi:3-hydroxymyristoyl/3-hydroxydecanoyl-(acyl carrier protein) dehydratase